MRSESDDDDDDGGGGGGGGGGDELVREKRDESDKDLMMKFIPETRRKERLLTFKEEYKGGQDKQG